MDKKAVIVIGMTAVLTLCLAAACAADLAPVPGLKLPEVEGKMFLAARNASPGIVLFHDATGEHIVFTRPAKNLTSFTFGRLPSGLMVKPGPMSLVFCNGVNQKEIWKATSPFAEALLLKTEEYVREVAFGPRGGLYYSHSSGAGGDGRIMCVAGGPPTVYTTIELAKIGGYWAGNFAFDPTATLYVSNGNRVGAQIWRYPPGGAPAPEAVFKDRGSILGFWFVDADNFLYTNGTDQVLKGHVGGTGPDGVAYDSPNRHMFCDVVIR